MASKAPPQDDFNLDDIKLDDFPMEDNALFADLDNEMRADGGGKAGGDDLDLNLDLDSGSGDSMPALEELDDTMDLDLNLDDAPASSGNGGGSDDLDLNLDEAPAAEASGEPDLDLDLNLDEGTKTDDADLQLDAGSSTGGDDELKLDDDLDLNLDDAPAAAEGGGDVDMDIDVGGLDLNLDDAPSAGGDDELKLDEPGEPSFSMDDPGEPKFDMDLPEDIETPAEEGVSLSLVEPEAPAAEQDAGGDLDLDLGEPDLTLDAEPAAAEAEPDLDLSVAEAPAEAPAAEPDLALNLDEGISLDALTDSTVDADAPAKEFQAAPDVNLDDMNLDEIDLSLEPAGGEEPAMQPLGAQVALHAPDDAAPSMDQGFDLPPLAETKGDTEDDGGEPFVAVPDVTLTEDEVLELNLSAASAQPEFTMEPEPLDDMPGDAMPLDGMGSMAAGTMGMGMGMAAAGMADSSRSGAAGEFRLTEPMSRGNGAARGGAPAMRASTPAAGGAGMRDAAISQEILLSIPHKISVQMGQVDLIGKDIRNLAYGSVVPLNRTVGEPVDLLLDGKAIAQGEIVLINGKNLGVRILALHK